LCFICNIKPPLLPTQLHAMIGENPICDFCNGLPHVVHEWCQMFRDEWYRQNICHPCECCAFDYGVAPQLFPHPPFSKLQQKRNLQLESLTVLSFDMACVKQYEQAVHECA
jgi:hypothetical protein